MTGSEPLAGRGWQAGDYVQRPLRELLDDTAGAAPVPAAGSAAAVTAALAAGLVAKVARRSSSRRADAGELANRADHLLDQLAPQVTADAAAYAATLAGGSSDGSSMDAASVAPGIVAEAGRELAAIAADLAVTGNPNLRYDAAAAESLARTAAQVAESLITANADRRPPQ